MAEDLYFLQRLELSSTDKAATDGAPVGGCIALLLLRSAFLLVLPVWGRQVQ